MRDANICPDCGASVPLGRRTCSCGASLVLPARGISLWRLGEVEPRFVQQLARRLERFYGVDVVLQPALLSPNPSRRPRPWRGISATAFLNQVDRRRRRGDQFALGITEENIVPATVWNFLFGLAYLDGRAAVMSLHPLRGDLPTSRKLMARAEKIATHELGHALGLDHHGYADGIPCTMAGDVEEDSLETLDAGVAGYCRRCRRTVGDYSNLPTS